MMSLGFRVLGDKTSPRRLVDAARCFDAYSQLRIDTDHEAYLSMWRYDDAVRERENSVGELATKDYRGVCWSPVIWWDIDRTDIRQALRDALRLYSVILAGYGEPVLLFSGKKGFHIGLPADGLPASLDFPQRAKAFALSVAEHAGVVVDGAVYNANQLFRAPNSRHPGSGLFKRIVDVGMDTDAVLSFAQQPLAFTMPHTPASQQLLDEWQSLDLSPAKKPANVTDAPDHLNRLTKEIIRLEYIPAEGERNRLFYSAAANLAELDCPPMLAAELLGEAASRAGYTRGELSRVILSTCDKENGA